MMARSLHVKICKLELSRTTIHNGIKNIAPLLRVCVSSSFDLSIRSTEFPLLEEKRERKENDLESLREGNIVGAKKVNAKEEGKN